MNKELLRKLDRNSLLRNGINYVDKHRLCLLLSLHLLTSAALRPLPARLLGFNYTLYAVQHFLAVLIFAFAWPPALILRPVMAMALGPALYFYSLSVAQPALNIRPVHLAHFLPVAIMASILASESQLGESVDYLIIISFSVYLCLVVSKLFKGSGAFGHLGSYAKPAYRWLWVLAGLMIINLLIEVLALWEINSGTPPGNSFAIMGGAISFLLFNAVTMLLALKRAPIIEWMVALGEDHLARRSTSTLTEAEARGIFHRWENLVEQKKLHLQETGITVKGGAGMLGLPARQLSEAVNRIYGSSFSQYINDRRVWEAQRLLQANPTMPITDLMFEAGFSTKSNFNKEFQRVTHMSPSEFRRVTW